MPRVTIAPKTVSDALVARERNPMLDPANRLKLAVFCANVARGTSLSHADTLPTGSWDESRRLAQAADRAGIDGFIPLARWKNTERLRPEYDRFMECFTWAAGLGASTARISVFATVHVPLLHPAIVAAMGSTTDHITSGRFAINVVAGFNTREFRMFGLEQLGHDERYEYAAEWITLLKRLWTAEEAFDFDGRYLRGQELISKPLPLQRPYPVIMSAGASPSGRRFAAAETDINFVHLPSVAGLPDVVSMTKREAREAGHEVSVFAGGYFVCAGTEAEAWRRYHHVVRDQLDVESTEALLEQVRGGGARSGDVIAPQELRDRVAAGFNALPLVGTAEQIATRMVEMAHGGLDGLALSFDDYDDGIAAYDEAVRPLLIQAGLRSV
jgi:alkanesulfonate monooxygenase SsuD/methylene tetrahydromethanopterin reductase-like flavin-dependent oxidoreductase (luciferase family)